MSPFADNYDEDSVPTDTPESENADDNAGPTDDAGKISQEQANYRRGSPVQHCGVCVHFVKPANDGSMGSCTKVAGAISPYAITDVYAEANNPFGPMLGPQERAAINEMSQSPPDQSRFVQARPVGSPEPEAEPAPETAEQSPPGVPQSPAPGMQRMRIGRQAY